MLNQLLLKYPQYHNFPGGPVFKTSHFQCREYGFNPWLRVKMVNALGGVAKKNPKHNIWRSCWTTLNHNHFPWSFQLLGPSSVHLQHIWPSCLCDNPPKFSLLQETCLAPSSPAHTWTWSDHYSLEHWAVPWVIWEYRGYCRLQGCILDSSVPDPAHQGHKGQDSAHPSKLVHREPRAEKWARSGLCGPHSLVCF